MKKIAVIVFMSLGIGAQAQKKWTVTEGTEKVMLVPAGIISGQIKTTDGMPAAFVTVSVKQNNKTAITDEQGSFHNKEFERRSVYSRDNYDWFKTSTKNTDGKKW